MFCADGYFTSSTMNMGMGSTTTPHKIMRGSFLLP